MKSSAVSILGNGELSFIRFEDCGRRLYCLQGVPITLYIGAMFTISICRQTLSLRGPQL